MSFYWENAIGPNCEEGLWFFDLFLTIFFVVGVAMPCGLLLLGIRQRQLVSALKSHGLQKAGQVIGKRSYVSGDRGRNRFTTHYMVMLQYAADRKGTGMEVAQKEFSVSGGLYSIAQERVTTIQVVHLPGDPLQALLAQDLDANNAGACFGGVYVAVFVVTFFTFWNGVLLLCAPWCYAPLWAYPIGACIGFRACGQQAVGEGQILSASNMAMQAHQEAGVTPLLALSPPSIADEIAKLSALHAQGALSNMEFQTAKQQVLNGRV